MLFSLYLHFVPCLPSQDPSLMPIITIFLSWDPSCSPYMPSNPYAILHITTGQGIFFLSLLLVMDAYSSSWFSRIDYIFLLLIFSSLMFHDLLPLLKQPIKQINCPRLSTRQRKPLTIRWVERVHFRDETPRELDWGCGSIPWSFRYHHTVCTCWYQICQYCSGQA